MKKTTPLIIALLFAYFSQNQTHGATQTLHIKPHQLISLALQRNPQILSIEKEQMARGFETQAAKSQWLPSPSISVEKGHDRPRLSLNQKTETFRLSQPIYTGGRLTAGLKKSQAAEQTTYFARQTALIRLSETLLETIGGLATAHQKKQSFEESEEKHLQYLALVSRRARLGQSAKADVSLAESRLLAVQADLLAARNEIELQKIRLKNLCQCNDEEISALDIHSLLQYVSQPNTANKDIEIENQALQISPMIKRMEQEQQITEALELEAKSVFYPQVSLRMDHTRGDNTGTDNILFLNVNLAIGAGLSAFQTLSAAQERVQGKSMEIEAEKINALQTIQSLLLIEKTTKTREILLKEAFATASSVMQASERLFLSGRKSWQELLNAARENYNAEVQFIDARVSTWIVNQKIALNSTPIEHFIWSEQ